MPIAIPLLLPVSNRITLEQTKRISISFPGRKLDNLTLYPCDTIEFIIASNSFKVVI